MAQWTTAFINSLPDSSFLLVEGGGKKDAEGKTTPRSLRHFPYKDASGKVDLPHLRNALSRIPQSSLSDAVKARLTTKAQGILDKQGGRQNAELETEDIEGVEILRAGVRIHGVGSPPGGDLYTADDLAGIAEATAALEGKRPLKIGHGKAQKLLTNSGLTDGETPAAGWLENVRADGERLVGDLKAVPKKVAKLMRSGAFRTRSVELKKNGEGKWAITALALLGTQPPAMKTLDDIVALYEEAEVEHADEGVAYLVYAAEEEDDGKKERAADIGATVADDLTLTADAQRELAESLGVELKDGAALTQEQIAEAFEAQKRDLEAAKTDAEAKAKELEDAKKEADERKNEDGDDTGEIKRELEEAQSKIRNLEEERRVEKRDAVIEKAISDGRLAPADRAKWAKDYDEAPGVTARHLEELPVDEVLVKEFGAEGGDEEQQEQDEKEYGEWIKGLDSRVEVGS